MAKRKTNLNLEVNSFLGGQKHPLRKEIEKLRGLILSSNHNLSENIKRNGSNYCLDGEDNIAK